jgi:hypothetical protein
MRINHSSKVFVSMMYIVTAVSLSLPGYIYLFNDETIFRIDEILDLVLNKWPSLFLLIALVLLIVGGLAIFWNEIAAYRLIKLGLISGWIFYGLIGCGLCYLTLGFVFGTIKGILFFLPSLLLAYSTITTMRLRSKAEK